MSLTIHIEKNLDQAVVQINGTMDITTIEVFATKMDKLAKVSQLLLDFSNLEFIDSTGIGAIMELIYLSQEQNFTIKLTGMDETIHKIFEIVGLFTILEALKKEGT
ncbi:STAS domain-containing protein [Neobacillus sp. K501]